jgi:hypothetical protein
VAKQGGRFRCIGMALHGSPEVLDVEVPHSHPELVIGSFQAAAGAHRIEARQRGKRSETLTCEQRLVTCERLMISSQAAAIRRRAARKVADQHNAIQQEPCHLGELGNDRALEQQRLPPVSQSQSACDWDERRLKVIPD